jgi:hypothetical protein
LLTPHPPAIAGARARNRFLKLIRITGTRFSRRKRIDNSAAFFASITDAFFSPDGVGRPPGRSDAHAGGGPTTLIGGPNDTLNAGARADTFVFQPDFGTNTINGFTAGMDAIQFDHVTFADTGAVQNHMQQVVSDVVIALDPQNVVTLHDVLIANLHA